MKYESLRNIFWYYGFKGGMETTLKSITYDYPISLRSQNVLGKSVAQL